MTTVCTLVRFPIKAFFGGKKKWKPFASDLVNCRCRSILQPIDQAHSYWIPFLTSWCPNSLYIKILMVTFSFYGYQVVYFSMLWLQIPILWLQQQVVSCLLLSFDFHIMITFTTLHARFIDQSPSFSNSIFFSSPFSSIRVLTRKYRGTRFI